MPGGGNEAIGGWDDPVHHGMDKLGGQQGACGGWRSGSTNEKTRPTGIPSHTVKRWLHGIKSLLCPFLGQA